MNNKFFSSAKMDANQKESFTEFLEEKKKYPKH